MNENTNIRKNNAGKNNQQSFSDKKKAIDFIETLKRILDFEKSSAKDISKGIEEIKTLIKENKNVTTHQIRNIFKLIKEVKTVKDLNIIRPRLAYISARQTEKDGKIYIDVLDRLIVEITKAPDDDIINMINGLKYIMESIVAYHKFYVGEK